MDNTFWLIPGLAVLNRLSGMDQWFPGRNIYATSVLSGMLGWLLVGPLFGALLFISMLTYRLPGWYDALDVGSDEGSPVWEFLVMSFRGMWIFPVFVYVGATNGDVIKALQCLVVAGLLFGLAYFADMYTPKKLTRGFVAEVFGGAALGLGLYAALHGWGF